MRKDLLILGMKLGSKRRSNQILKVRVTGEINRAQEETLFSVAKRNVRISYYRLVTISSSASTTSDMVGRS
jgi:hypothetical protein